MIKKLMQFLIRIINAQLFERIHSEILEPKDI